MKFTLECEQEVDRRWIAEVPELPVRHAANQLTGLLRGLACLFSLLRLPMFATWPQGQRQEPSSMRTPRTVRSTVRGQARWSQRVTEQSNALDLEPGVFTWQDPHQIASSLKTSAESSRRRKSSAFRSAMSMLNFYINRAGKHLSSEQRIILEAAKDELRMLYGRQRRGIKD